MSALSVYIKKQKERNDLCGDFARDFIRTVEGPEVWVEDGDINELESETLYGFYQHLPHQRISLDSDVFLALVELWKEWICYKHIGLKFNAAPVGYIYFFNIPGKNVFKIGRTALNPETRKLQVEAQEKVNLEIYNWIKIKNYDLIETELKNAFRKYQIQREWFQFEYVGDNFCLEIDEAIECYSKTSEDYETMKPIGEDDE